MLQLLNLTTYLVTYLLTKCGAASPNEYFTFGQLYTQYT